MRIYDNVFLEFKDLVSKSEVKSLGYGDAALEGDKNQFIFKNDAAYELGGGTYSAISGIIYTSLDEPSKDEVILIGEDLNQIKKDSNYARIVVVDVDDDKLGSGNELYQNLRRIDYVRYHIIPKGIMVRISSMNKKESLLVSKDALKEGTSFKNIGSMFIDAYKKIPSVKSVKIYFISQDSFPYKELAAIMEKSESITAALDHLMNKVKMDCHSCSLQKVCEEVEKMVETDFKKN